MRRILVVDDNLAFADNLAEIIGDAGVGEPVIADSGDRALVLVRGRRFDVLVTDMRMPGMDGAELIRHVRAVDPSLPIVVVTAFSAAEQLQTVANEGVLCVFAKPPPIAELLRAIAGARRGIVAVIAEGGSALASEIAEALRARGVATVTTLDQLVVVGSAAVIALVHVRAAKGEGRLSSLAARFPDKEVIEAIDRQHALAAIEAICGSSDGEGPSQRSWPRT